MAKDINIHLKTKGAEQTQQKLSGVGKAAQQVGDSAQQGGRKGADGMDKLSRSAGSAQGRFSRFTSGLSSWAAGLFGITATIAVVTRAIQVQGEALKEHARIAAEQQKKLLALQAMGTFFEEHPEARKEVAAYAEFGRRPIPEVTEAWYALESKGAGLTEEQKVGIMREALELGRMEPEADLKGIIEVFSLYAKETGEQNINLIQNVLRTTLSKAGAELSELSQYLPQFQSLGIAAGLTGEEAAGLWAYATTRTGKPETATVGLRNIFMALQGKGTPESQELLPQLGITPEMGFYEQISQLAAARQAGKLGVPEAETIAMKESAALLLSMLTDTQAMMRTIGEVSAAARPDIDIVADRLEQIMGEDEVAFLEEEKRRLDVVISGMKGRDVKALRWDVALKEYERQMREAKVPETWIAWQLKKYQQAAGLGWKIKPQWLLEPFGEFVEFPKEYEQGPAEPIETEVEVPIEPQAAEEKEPISKAITVPTEVPEEIPAGPFEVEAVAAAFARPVGSAKERLVAVSHYYDNSIKYYPRVGDDLVGPRFPGV